MHLGRQHLDLIEANDATPVPPPASAPSPRFQHAAIVTNDIEASWRRLQAHPFDAISRGGPQRLPQNTGGVTAFKFRDPDGHPLELIQFPPGIGDPCWQVGGREAGTLGIDHVALVVASVEASVAFFVDQLDGLVSSRGLNRGIEQDRLDGLDAVEVEVVALVPRRGARTPHLELLGYRQPRFDARNEAPLRAFDPGRDEVVVLRRAASSKPDRRVVLDPDGHRFAVDGSGLAVAPLTSLP